MVGIAWGSRNTHILSRGIESPHISGPPHRHKNEREDQFHTYILISKDSPNHNTVRKFDRGAPKNKT